MSFTRRHFIVTLGGTLLAVLAGRVSSLRPAAPLPGVGRVELLLSSGSAYALGEACLKLPDCARAATQLALTGVEHEAAELHRRIRDDFERGEVVFVDGWMLARSEASLYAWAALTNPARRCAG